MTRPRVPVTAWRTHRPAVRLYRFLQVALGWMLRMVFHIRRTGHRTVPKTGGVLLVSNHVSNLDPVFVIASMRRPVFHLAKHTLFQRRFWNFFFGRLGGQIPVDRDTGGNVAALEAALLVLDHGGALGVYPEGTRTRDGRIRRGRTGVARIAYASGAPIYPVAIDGGHLILPRGARVPRLFVQRVNVRVGPVIRVPRDAKLAEDPKACRDLTDRIMAALADLLGQTYDPKRLSPPFPPDAAQDPEGPDVSAAPTA